MFIKTQLGALKNIIVKSLMPFKVYKIGDYKVQALRGTIRKKTDLDDAWLYELLNHCNSFFDIGCNVGYTLLPGLVQKDLRCVFGSYL